MCLYPRLIPNPKYKRNKKNGGIIPPVLDNRVLAVPIGCETCIECRRQRARDWQLRLLEEVKERKGGKFITLTFSNESIKELWERQDKKLSGYEMDNAIATTGVRLFLERWRKKYKRSLRHWLVTELGGNGTENIHLHGIVWSGHGLDELAELWKYGYVWPRSREERKRNYVSSRTVNYVIKYITKIDERHKGYKARVLTSSGIGSGFTNSYSAVLKRFKGTETDEAYRTESGHKIAMPIYWRNKIYSEEEREKLWLMKLDESVRYVVGEKIDTREGYEAYWKLVKYHRERNERLGYGNGLQSWDQQEYERKRREYLLDVRIGKRAGASPKTGPEG